MAHKLLLTALLISHTAFLPLAHAEDTMRRAIGDTAPINIASIPDRTPTDTIATNRKPTYTAQFFSNICQTPAGWCQMFSPIPRGSACFCVFPGLGSVSGFVP